ncbi:MAG: hypothetical protein WA705_05215 [Candidatus Ozemobacteraceae bacterium]
MWTFIKNCLIGYLVCWSCVGIGVSFLPKVELVNLPAHIVLANGTIAEGYLEVAVACQAHTACYGKAIRSNVARGTELRQTYEWTGVAESFTPKA